jgi:hypothetical protein
LENIRIFICDGKNMSFPGRAARNTWRYWHCSLSVVTASPEVPSI